MRIAVKRRALRPTYTIGSMYIDGAYLCDTHKDTSGCMLLGDDKVVFYKTNDAIYQ